MIRSLEQSDLMLRGVTVSKTNSPGLNNSPISRIPPEILLRIFEHIWAFPSARRFFSDTNTRWDWLAITSTCHHWRCLTMSTASLWTNIGSFRNLDMLQAIIDRSQDADLTLKLSYDSDFNPLQPEHAKIIAPLIGRAREIHVVNLWSRTWDEVVRLLSDTVSFSRLKILKLLNPTTYETPGQTTTMDLPQLSSQARLNELTLYNVYIPLSGSFIKDLRKLEISGVHVPIALLDILAQCTEIEVLLLESVKLTASASTSRTNSLIELPHLQVITLMDLDFDSYLEFTSFINPSLSSFIVNCSGYDFGSRKPLLSDSIGRILKSLCNNVALMIDKESIVFIFFKDSMSSKVFVEEDKKAVGISWKTEGDASESPTVPTLDHILKLVKQPYLETMSFISLTVDSDFLAPIVIQRGTWIQLFRSTESLKRLQVIFHDENLQRSSDELVLAFAAPNPDSNSDIGTIDFDKSQIIPQQSKPKSGPFCLPNLESLYLRSFSTSTVDIYRMLVQHLCDRRDGGKCLRKLSIDPSAFKFGDAEEEGRKLRCSMIADHLEIYDGDEADSDESDDEISLSIP